MPMMRKYDDWYYRYFEYLETDLGDKDTSIACITCDGGRFTRGRLLRLLRNDKSAWNRWRRNLTGLRWYNVEKRLRNIPGFIVRLKGVDLRRVDLSGAILSSCDFSGSNFTKTNFSGATFGSALTDGYQPPADFSFCKMRSTDMSGTHADGANFQGCDFSHAELNGTDFSRSNLSGATLFKAFTAARFHNTTLSKTDFSSSYIISSDFVDTDLSGAVGITSAYLYPPNVVDGRTIVRSGSLPRALYRTAGYPDSISKSIMSKLKTIKIKPRCFVSYSAQDEGFVRSLHRDLEHESIETFFAPRDLPFGVRTREALDEAVQEADWLIVVLSKNSVKSHWVEQEIETAFELERKLDRVVLMPVSIDKAVMKSRAGWAAHLRRTRNIGLFSSTDRDEEYFKTFAQLVTSIRDQTP